MMNFGNKDMNMIQEIVDELVTRGNFKKYLKICIEHNLEISDKCLPYINVYRDDKWYGIHPSVDYFEVNGELMTGNKNFFLNYDKITKFILKRGSKDDKYLLVEDDKYLLVEPHMINGIQWTKEDDSDWHEISYNLHSYSKPALLQKSVDRDSARYFIHGESVPYDKWKFLSREHKLKRILSE